MSIIPRPPKAGGETNFLQEVLIQGNVHIKAGEVDADFNTLYDDYNGNITNANLSPTANIATSKIAPDAGLQTGHLADGSVTSDKILDGTIDTQDLAPDSVTTAKILDGNVTLAKMAPGSSVRYANHQVDSTIVVGAEAAALVHPSRTPHGAASITTFVVACQGFISLQAVGTLTQINMRLKKDGITVQLATTQVLLPAAGVTMVNMEVAFGLTITHLDALTTDPTVWQVSLEKVESGSSIATVTGISSLMVEHA